MDLFGRSLSKLTLTAFRDKGFHQKIGSFVAMFNPESIRFGHEASYRSTAALNDPNQMSEFDRIRPPDLDFELVLDSRATGLRRTIDDQLGELRTLCFAIGAKGGEPSFLRVSWGKLSWHGHGYFSGRCRRLGVSYTLFDRNAQPLRATAQLSLVGVNTDDVAAFQGKGGLGGMVATISAHDTLPLIASLAGTAAAGSDYLKLGQANGLDNLRDLSPGKSLFTL